MNDQPTGEWTVESAEKIVGNIWNRGGIIELLVDAHNAALAAERENLIVVSRTIGDLRQQLAAEREKREEAQRKYQRDYDELLNLNKRDKHKPLVKALQEIANASEASADSLRRYAANEIARLNQNTGLDWIGRGDQ